MKNMIAIVLGMLTLTQQAFAETTRGEVAELSVHRLEKLVILKKIEPSFQTQSSSINIEILTSANPETDPSYRVTIIEGKAQDDTQKTLILEAALPPSTGKLKWLSFATTGSKEPLAPLSFPDKDAASLLEVGLHCVQGEAIDASDLCSKIPELSQFNEKTSQVNLFEVRDSSNKITGAKIEILGEGLKQKALIDLTLDGKLNGENAVTILAI